MNDRKKVSKLLFACQLAFATSFIPFTTAQAASIMWQAPVRISGDTDVKTQGTLLGAYAFSNSPSGQPISTVNGVPFITAPANGSQGYVTSAGAQFAYNGFNTTVAPYINLSYNYRQVILRGLYSSAAPDMTVTLTGLTGGQTYLIQLWVNDSRGNNTTNPDTLPTKVFFSTGTAPLSVYNSATVEGMDVAEVPGKLGQYVVGYLTMGAAETSVTLKVNPLASPKQINAIQIRTISGGPTAWMAEAKYGIMLHYQIGGVLGSHMGSGMGYSEQASLYQAGGNKPQSEWSAKINNFKVADFANDAAAAGAGWVIISVGSKYGYYSSHNNAFEAKGEYPAGSGPLVKGEFTPKPLGGEVNGDLIGSLGAALKAKGIPLFVYMASEGPWDATTVIKSNGQPVEMKFSTFAQASGTPWSPGAHPNFQTLVRAMISEWSNRWKSDVAGWWFDGTFSGTGYAANGVAFGGGPIGATTALSNLDGLVTAAKSGNPASLVALNPGFNRMNALAESQDYLAGEWAAGGPSSPTSSYADDPNGKFAIYPTSQMVTFGAKNMQWHTMSFLGDKWRGPRKAYANEELASYINKVSSVGGAVTLDVYYTLEGRIPKVFLDQLKVVKATLKPNAIPAATPTVPIVNFANLALFKPAYMKVNTPGNIDSADVQPLGEGTHRANGGNDGNFRSRAESNHLATPPIFDYSYIVDLGSDQTTFDRIVFYPDGRYSTSYQIYYSTDGFNWQHINAATTTYSASNSGVKLHNTDSVKTGRYIKIKSLAPNQANQPGVAMSVSELEVYNTTAVPVGADTVWMDDYISGVRQHPLKTDIVTLTGTWNWFEVMANTYDPVNPGLYPQPRDGVRYHVSGSGINEHGFTNTPATLKLGNNDSLYCWVWVADATPEILLKWTATDGTVRAARWGDQDNIIPGTYRAGAVPAVNAAPFNDMPAVTLPNGNPGDSGQWVRLSVPASSIGLAGKTLKGMSFAANGGKVFFDRFGKMTP